MNPNDFFSNLLRGQQGFGFNPFNPGPNVNVHMGNQQNINNFYGMPDGQQYPGPFQQNMNNPRQDRPPQPQESKVVVPDKNPDIIQAENNPSSGHYYKRIGNEYYKRGLYAQAIENYTKAIEKNDTEAVFYSNRARSYKNLGNLAKANDDVRTAIELDDTNVKSHLLWGQILVEMGKTEPGFDKLNKAQSKVLKAISLCSEEDKKVFGKDLHKNLMRIRKAIWLKQQAVKRQKKIEVLSDIEKMINKDTSIDSEAKNQICQEILNVVGKDFTPTLDDIPDYLCCKITMDIMDDPVITAAGITYEKAALTDHFSRNGNFDPVTRETIEAKHTFSNKAIKANADVFLKENPWVFEFQDNEDYLKIKF